MNDNGHLVTDRTRAFQVPAVTHTYQLAEQPDQTFNVSCGGCKYAERRFGSAESASAAWAQHRDLYTGTVDATSEPTGADITGIDPDGTVHAVIHISYPMTADPQQRAAEYEGRYRIADCVRYDFDHDLPGLLADESTNLELVAVARTTNDLAGDLATREQDFREQLAVAAAILETQIAGVKSLGKFRTSVLTDLVEELRTTAVTGNVVPVGTRRRQIFEQLAK